MNKLLPILLVVILGACGSHHHKVIIPSGEEVVNMWHNIAHNQISYVYSEMGEFCGNKGYTIYKLKKNFNPVGFAEGFKSWFVCGKNKTVPKFFSDKNQFPE